MQTKFPKRLTWRFLKISYLKVNVSAVGIKRSLQFLEEKVQKAEENLLNICSKNKTSENSKLEEIRFLKGVNKITNLIPTTQPVLNSEKYMIVYFNDRVLF